MDVTAETLFVKSYIRKNRQERILFELTTPARRYNGLSRFCHQAGELINPARISMEGEDLNFRAEFTAFVRKHNESAGSYLRIRSWIRSSCRWKKLFQWQAWVRMRR